MAGLSTRLPLSQHGKPPQCNMTASTQHSHFPHTVLLRWCLPPKSHARVGNPAVTLGQPPCSPSFGPVLLGNTARKSKDKASKSRTLQLNKGTRRTRTWRPDGTPTSCPPYLLDFSSPAFSSPITFNQPSTLT